MEFSYELTKPTIDRELENKTQNTDLLIKLYNIFINRYFFIHYAIRFMVKIQLVHSCTFKGFPKLHWVRYLIFKACVGRIDPMEDLSEKGNFPPGSCRAAIHDGNNMTCEITI